ncbi:hypothetical protein [Natrialbaceae archaeon AArc-T1-2]|uniref:hypothetical protein n=1 Tax=Natrialbaceae archaeon AArc-T1-2 TaxID=3053904 RepID=UPI00255B2163|nr:hypothetical protein [Natrialbaceae archaeon AArc-T1-2]WIV66579.1 hypothetical protein QQ977_12890 [Natrialbaceae archaeon AArc-T1-2]
MGDAASSEPAGPGERVYIALGVVCAVVAVYVYPIVFGPAAIYFGGRLYGHGSQPTGVMVASLGVLGLFLGLLYGLSVQ